MNATMNAAMSGPALVDAGWWLDRPFGPALVPPRSTSRSLSLDRLARSLTDAELDACLPAALKHASARRRIAFVGGRLCAAAALDELGAGACRVPIGAGGGPCWPAGWTGSITHTDRVAHAVVLAEGAVAAIGIDAEPVLDARGADDVAMVCCSERERERYGSADAHYASNMTTLFAVKEAYYKACRDRCGAFIDFDDVEVQGDLRAGRAVVRPVAASRLADRLPEAVARFAIGHEAGRPCVHATVTVDLPGARP